MKKDFHRRDFLALAGLGDLVFASGLTACSRAAGAAAPATALAGRSKRDDFFFLQMSDTHWGYSGPSNPQADVTLEHAVATLNALDAQPDFIVFTGDLTHTTDDATQRRERMKRFREIASRLKVKELHFLPGEHDAAPDRGEAYRENFGEPTYAFVHKGVHFVALDNASQPGGAIGEGQLRWLEDEVAKVPSDVPLVVLAHRPLFPLWPDWEWATKDGARAVELLDRRGGATMFYGHIHQENHTTTGAVTHHAARSLVFPLPAPGSVPKKVPLPWDPASPDHGLGWRTVAFDDGVLRAREEPFR
ncbi:MAG: metallophosphoesterase family protein [Polyangiaceae bacterium]